MFSNRFEWQTPENALGLLAALKRAAGRRILDLTQSNPTGVGLDYDTAEILAALSQPAAMRYEPDAHGLTGARQAVAAYYAEFGDAPDPDRIFLTASTSEAYGFLFKLLGDPGDEVLIPRPGYPLLSYLTRFEGLRAVAYPLRYDDATGWSIDLEVMRALITPRTRAVVLVSPNNPTGSYVKPDELAVIDEICRRHDMAVIVDEVFADYAAADTPALRVPTSVDNGAALYFVLNGFSKMVALPQVKLGWIAVAGDSGQVTTACRRLSSLLDFYLSVSTPVQHAAARLLNLRPNIQPQIVTRLETNSCFLQDRMRTVRHGRCLRREGGWYAVVDFSDPLSDEERVLRLLDRDDTLVHPGFFYDFHREGFVVISLLPRSEDFRAGIENLLGAWNDEG